MAETRPEPWSAEEAERVKDLLTTFSGDKDTVCAVMDCRRGDLDWLCRQAFGMNFARAVEKYELVGKANLKKALMRAAMDDKPNSKALDFAIREYLDILGPVERRREVERQRSRDRDDQETDF